MEGTLWWLLSGEPEKALDINVLNYMLQHLKKVLQSYIL